MVALVIVASTITVTIASLSYRWDTTGDARKCGRMWNSDGDVAHVAVADPSQPDPRMDENRQP